MWREDVWGKSVPPAQFCCELIAPIKTCLLKIFVNFPMGYVFYPVCGYIFFILDILIYFLSHFPLHNYMKWFEHHYYSSNVLYQVFITTFYSLVFINEMDFNSVYALLIKYITYFLYLVSSCCGFSNSILPKSFWFKTCRKKHLEFFVCTVCLI